MRYIKVVVSVFLTIIALMVLVFGPRPEAPRPTGRVTVTYWEKWTGIEAEQMKQIVDDFNDTVGAQKGIYVEFLSMGNITQKTLISTAAGVPPDVAGLWDHQIPQFSAIDALEPLDEMARAHGITKAYYKPVYWRTCQYRGRLYGLISSGATVALLYNKRIFRESAKELRAAGLDPNRPPRTLDELDRYAKALDVVDKRGNLMRSGYIPMESWWIAHTPLWFGGSLFDPKTERFTLTDPKVVKAFEWIRSYSLRMGKGSITEFRSGMGSFNSAQNPFMVGKVAMVQQGPWMANIIDANRPKMNRVLTNDKQKEMTWPIEKRKENYEWAAAPFPSAVPGLKDVTCTPCDVLVIPRGARHPKEAFEFIAYVNQQGPMEKLCAMQCKNSPLNKVSSDFLNNHPNPYIAVFDELAASPNASPAALSIAIWPEVQDEVGIAAQRIYLLEQKPVDALREAQVRLQEKYDSFRAAQEARER